MKDGWLARKKAAIIGGLGPKEENKNRILVSWTVVIRILFERRVDLFLEFKAELIDQLVSTCETRLERCASSLDLGQETLKIGLLALETFPSRFADLLRSQRTNHRGVALDHLRAQIVIE